MAENRINKFIQHVFQSGVKCLQHEKKQYSAQDTALMRLNEISYGKRVPYNLRICTNQAFSSKNQYDSRDYIDITLTNSLVKIASMKFLQLDIQLNKKNQVQTEAILKQLKQLVTLLYKDYNKIHPGDNDPQTIKLFVDILVDKFIQLDSSQEEKIAQIKDDIQDSITKDVEGENTFEPDQSLEHAVGPLFQLRMNTYDIVKDSIVKELYDQQNNQMSHINNLVSVDLNGFDDAFEQYANISTSQIFDSLLITKLMLDDKQRYKVLYIIQNTSIFNKLDNKQRNQIITLALYILEQKYDHYCMLILTYSLKIQQNDKLIAFFIERLLFHESQLCWYLVNMFMYDWKGYTSLYENIGNAILSNEGKKFSDSFYTIIRHLNVDKLKYLAAGKDQQDAQNRLKKIVKALRWF